MWVLQPLKRNNELCWKGVSGHFLVRHDLPFLLLAIAQASHSYTCAFPVIALFALGQNRLMATISGIPTAILIGYV